MSDIRINLGGSGVKVKIKDPFQEKIIAEQVIGNISQDQIDSAVAAYIDAHGGVASPSVSGKTLVFVNDSSE